MPRTTTTVSACVVVLAALLLSGCGFHLSKPPELGFQTLFVSAPTYSSFGADVKRYLASNNSQTRLVDRPEEAEVVLEIISEVQETQILAISVGGRVNELQLRFRVLFSVRDQAKHQWIAPTELLVLRDMTYDDQTVLAKENEQSLLVQDMRQDAVRQIVRRLASAHAPT